MQDAAGTPSKEAPDESSSSGDHTHFNELGRCIRLPKVDENHRFQGSPSKEPGLCVDELCTCGQHRCPPVHVTTQFEGSSTYNDYYKFCLPNPKEKVSDHNNTRKPVPFEGSSTYANTFNIGVFTNLATEKAKELRTIEAAREANKKTAYVKDTRDFSTTYAKYYKKPHITVCPVSKLPPVPPVNYPQQHAFWDPLKRTWY